MDEEYDECEKCHRSSDEVYLYDVREIEGGPVTEQTYLCQSCKETFMSQGFCFEYAD